MPRNYAILALLLVAASGCPAVYAGDFVPRATGGYASAGDDSGAGVGRVAATAAMGESDAPVLRTPDADAAPAPGTRRAAPLVGADDTAGGAHAALPPSAPVADGDDKPAPASPHKAHALRWQSLLPGVMK